MWLEYLLSRDLVALWFVVIQSSVKLFNNFLPGLVAQVVRALH